MTYSELLAELLGPVLVAIGLAMLTNRRSREAIAGQLPHSFPVVFANEQIYSSANRT